MRFTLVSLIVLMGVIQGVVLGVVLLDKKRRNFKANRFLALLILLMSLRLLNGFLSRSPLFNVFPFTARFTLFLVFAYLPLFYFYARAMTEPDYRFRPADLWHFVPSGMVFVATLPFYAAAIFSSRAEVLAYGRHWGWESPLLNGLVVVQQIAYFILILRIIGAYRRRIKELVASLDRIRLTWIVVLLSLMVVLMFIVILVVVQLVASAPGSWLVMNRDLVFYGIMAATIFAAGYFALSQPEVFTPPLARAARKYEGSSLIPARAEEHLRMLTALMENDAVYRDESLSLPSLSEKAGIPPAHVSQVLNERLNKSFYDFVNGFRIEDAKRRLRDPRTQSQKIIAIAFDVGFNSKAAFNRVFKNATGKTPSEFRRDALAS